MELAYESVEDFLWHWLAYVAYKSFYSSSQTVKNTLLSLIGVISCGIALRC